MRILTNKDYNVSRWDGGYTRELYLYPPDGEYQKRDFKVRISSAVMEKEISRFTSLPGVIRYLMMLQGTVGLKREHDKRQELLPYQVISFMGEEEIISYGKGTDMNLMLKDGAKGSMSYVEIEKNNQYLLPDVIQDQEIRVIYFIEGTGCVNGKNISQGETVIVNADDAVEWIENVGKDSMKLCVFQIYPT